MKAIMAWTGGRAPPSQNRPTPYAGSRWLGAARGSHAPAPCPPPPRPRSGQPAGPDHARLGEPSCAGSRPSSRSWPRSIGWPRTASRARLGDPAPSGPRARGPQENMGVCALSWLHPLNSGSLRETRCGSAPGLGSRWVERAERASPDRAETAARSRNAARTRRAPRVQDGRLVRRGAAAAQARTPLAKPPAATQAPTRSGASASWPIGSRVGNDLLTDDGPEPFGRVQRLEVA